jgi:hypothetical protein
VTPLKRSSTTTFEIRPLDRDDRDWVAGLIEKQWGSTKIVTRSKIHHADELPGFAAMMDDEPIGLITYRMEEKECEIITLDSLHKEMGVGSALVNAVEKVAVDFRCK